MDNSPVLTIGHSTRTLDEFIELLKTNAVTMVVDVRTVPRSRYNPQFNMETLPGVLSQYHIGYSHIAGLGGLRHPHRDSINGAWLNAGFRGFADYMQSEEFEQQINTLVDLSRREKVVLM